MEKVGEKWLVDWVMVSRASSVWLSGSPCSKVIGYQRSIVQADQ